MSNEMSNEERALIIRSFFATKGYGLQDEMFGLKYEQVRNQFLFEKGERHTDFREWTNDKLAGMALGIGWCRSIMTMWLQQYEQSLRTQNESAAEEVVHGHPYAEDVPVSN